MFLHGVCIFYLHPPLFKVNLLAVCYLIQWRYISLPPLILHYLHLLRMLSFCMWMLSFCVWMLSFCMWMLSFCDIKLMQMSSKYRPRIARMDTESLLSEQEISQIYPNRTNKILRINTNYHELDTNYQKY